MKPKFYLASSILSAFILSVLILFSSKISDAAACCGGGFASPSLISSDDKAQLTTSVTTTQVVIDNVDSAGFWRSGDAHQTVNTLKIEAAHIFWDRWQAGFSLPITQRQFLDQRYTGISDTALQTGYEYLPDWNYNVYRPKGIGFLTLVIPSGKSKVESEVGGLDSRGNGFWALGLGTLLTKTWAEWDAFLNLELHQALKKKLNNQTYSGELRPGRGGQFGIGAGFNTADYRFGTSVSWTYEDAIKLKSSTEEKTIQGVEKYATATLSFSRLFSEELSASISLTDQTLFGEPLNTSLGRGVSVQLQRKWGR